MSENLSRSVKSLHKVTKVEAKSPNPQRLSMISIFYQWVLTWMGREQYQVITLSRINPHAFLMLGVKSSLRSLLLQAQRGWEYGLRWEVGEGQSMSNVNLSVWQGQATGPPRLLLLLSHFSRVRLCATPQTAAHQAPRSLGFSRQEHWSGLPLPSPAHQGNQSKQKQWLKGTKSGYLQ